MTETLLRSLIDSGVRIVAEGDMLRVNAPKGRLTPALRASIKASKQEKDAGFETFSVAPIIGRYEGQDIGNVHYRVWLSKRRNIHPTVKPIQLMAYLVTMGSREGDIVLDPFAGSGTSLIAAHMLNRRFIGIEREVEYHRIATKRIAHFTDTQTKEDKDEEEGKTGSR